MMQKKFPFHEEYIWMIKFIVAKTAGTADMIMNQKHITAEDHTQIFI